MELRLTVIDVDCARGDYRYEKQHLPALGVDLVFRPAQTEDAIIAACEEADILLLEHAATPVTARVVQRLQRCRAIVKYSVGVENIDLEEATRQGIVVCNAPDYCTEEVSDHAAALLLAGARRVVAMDRHIRAGGWLDFPQAPAIRRIRSLTLGLVGLGRIGGMTARKLSSFGMRMLAADPFLPPGRVPPGVELVALETLLRHSDLISVHVPLSPKTRGLIGEAELRLVKSSAILVNTSRGAIIDEEALVRALRDSRLAGAGLDVFMQEPLPLESPLRGFDNVTLTPHYAAGSIEAKEESARTVIASIDAIARGHWPPFLVNPDVRPRFPLVDKPYVRSTSR
jgi:D-3-phosphoglycerate dehydrogenase